MGTSISPWAQATMEALPNPSFCKIMLPSMVSGGFWMEAPHGRGLHSSTFRLNVSAFYGIGGALRDSLGVVLRAFRRCWGVFRGVKGAFRVRYGLG